MLGSSRTYSTPTSADPIWVARRIRCASPPDRLPAARPSVRYSRPTLSRNPSRASISLRISFAILSADGDSLSPAINDRSSVTDKSHSSLIFFPPTVTASASLRSLLPPHEGHGTYSINAS